MKYPAIVDVVDFVKTGQYNSRRLDDGRFVPARPEPYEGTLIWWKAVWLVLTGQADALVWPGQ